MIRKITFDFFNESIEESVQKICAYFQLDKDVVKEYINIFEEPSDITAKDFIVNFKIDLTAYDTGNVEIMCRHMTAMTKEGILDIKERGLLDLIRVLSEDTVLSRFLKDNQVVFDLPNKKLYVDGQDYMITTTEEECLFCIEKKEVRCDTFIRCDIKDKMDSIGRKIYELGGTLEFFLSGTKEDMERYSVIHMNPEILETLDQLLAKIKVKTKREEPFALSYKWRAQKMKTYILQFPICLTDIETFNVCNYERAYYEYEEILECSGYTHSDYLMHLIPDTLYQNMKIIEWFLAASLCGNYQLGSLLPGKVVEPSQIQIVEEYYR